MSDKSKTQQFLDAMISIDPRYLEKVTEITQLAIDVQSACGSLLDEPATAENMAKFVVAISDSGIEKMKAEAAAKHGLDSENYKQTAVYLDGVAKKLAKYMMDVAAQAPALAMSEGLHEGALIAAIIAKDPNLAFAITLNHPTSVWDIVLMAPTFFQPGK